MEYLKLKDEYILKLQADEEIIDTIKQFAIAKKIKSGFLWGIGTAKEITLGYYDVKEKLYKKRLFIEDHEISSLIGNISYIGTDPIIHIHIVISPENFVSYSGHLFSAKVSATCEIMIKTYSKKIMRIPENQIGLNLLHLRPTRYQKPK
ncbi:MAG: PPC domain-containing DNA-binding protein [candidate division WOR-3 bacterium]